MLKIRKIWQFLLGQNSETNDESPTAQVHHMEGEDGLSIQVRNYESRDRRDVLRIAKTSFEGVCLDENIEERFGQVGDSWREHKKSAVAHDLRHNPDSAFVALADGHIVGFVCNRLYRSRRLGHVANLAVTEDYQGRGVGKALMRRTLEHFERKGMKFVRIETLEQNKRAREFYPKLGFEEVGRQVFFFREL